MRQEMNHRLKDTIAQLAATGKEGFEGLIAELLAELTGRRFQLAKSGSQAGRDMSSRQIGANVIAVECKRYNESTPLNERELQGELAQVIQNMPDLDLWVLVTSRSIPSQLDETLHQQARRANIQFSSISAGDATPSSLEILCAASPNVVLKYAAAIISQDEQVILRQALNDLSAQASFAKAAQQLKEEFLTPMIGFDNWRSSQNQWTANSLSSDRESRANYGQPINVGEHTQKLIPRGSAWKEMDDWFVNWGKEHNILVVLGEEGDGKTWATASWFYGKIGVQESIPGIILVSSQQAETSDPFELLTGVVSRQHPELKPEEWQARLRRWLSHPSEGAPQFILVLDGINEHREPQWWRRLLDQLTASLWCEAVALVITCRASYWQRYFADLGHLPTRRYVVQPYDTQEFNVALASHGLTLPDISQPLLPLIRRPRYFDLMVKHRVRMSETGDITIARLIYEDWQDRHQRRALGLDGQEFRDLLRDLASQYLEKKNSIRERELEALLPSYSDRRAIVEELSTGGVLWHDGDLLRVDENRLIHGLALLLLDQLRQEASAKKPNYRETISAWLEPQPDMDIKARICEFAVLLTLEDPHLVREAKIAMLEAWANSHNSGEKAAENLTSYYPIDPACYLEFAEIIWADASENPWAQERLLNALLRWPDLTTVDLPSTFERWLGFVHLDGFSYQRGKTESDVEKIRQEICQRIGQPLEPGPIEFANRKLTAIQDDGLLRLGRTALTVISHIPRGPFIHAITTGCVAEAIMGDPDKYDLFRWVMSTSPQSLWPEVEAEVQQLLKTEHQVTQQAAYRLLSFEGSKNAHESQRSFPSELFPLNFFQKQHQADPCALILNWSQEECLVCLGRVDISVQELIRHSQRYCLDPDFPIPDSFGERLEPVANGINTKAICSKLGATIADLDFDTYEPCLCAYAPEALANQIRTIAQQVQQRKGLPLRQLAIFLRGHYLILQRDQQESIFTAWRQLLEAAPDWDETQKYTEMFLFALVLRALSGEEQLRWLLGRPEEAPDWLTYEQYFKPLTRLDTLAGELNVANDPQRIRRVLWFLTRNTTALDIDNLSAALLQLLEHEDSLIRACVLEIAYRTKCKVLIEAFAQSEWAWSDKLCPPENHWGSLLLCEFGNQKPYIEIHHRICPDYLGYAIRCRGANDADLYEFAMDVDMIWARISSHAPELPPDFPSIDVQIAGNKLQQTRFRLSSDYYSTTIHFRSRESTWGGVTDMDTKDITQFFENPAERDQQHRKLAKVASQAIKEQVRAGNTWFTQSVETDGLDELVRRQPQLITKWVAPVLCDTPEAKKLLRLAYGFYTGLCMTLMKFDPPRGIQLYEKMQERGSIITMRVADSGFALLDYALFRMPAATPDVCDAWQRQLELCTTDLDLMRVAMMAQYGNGLHWLDSYTKTRIQSCAPQERSRALTLLGFLEAQESSDILPKLLQAEPKGWVGQLLKASLDRSNTNAWAKHWYKRFLSHEDDLQAWAAYRQFLRCVDSRFWFWKASIEAEIDSCKDRVALRLQHLQGDIDSVVSKIRENDKPLKEHLYGQKILHGQVWPWM